jgi:1-acyl-sn-glycerol-3-phosphate acyltransferase
MKDLRQLAANALPFAGRLFSFDRARGRGDRPKHKTLYVFLCWIARIGTRMSCRLDLPDLDQVPMQGPLILVSNHIGDLEIPLLFAHLQPRRLFGLAKVETWDNPFMGWLFDLWEAIPVRRGEADLEAFRRSLQVLQAGDILAIAPEGTRSRHGRLLRGQPGIVSLALRTGAPILPLAHWGGEDFGRNLKRLKRTTFHTRVGKPFTLDARGEKVTSEVRQAMVDEIMVRLAELLPEPYRGEYAACDKVAKYIRFE